MPGHKLIAGDAVQQGMHDRPLRGDRLQPARGLLRGQFDRGGPAQVDMQRTAFHKNPAPYHVSGLADSVEGAPAQAEVHRRLPFAARLGITARDMRSGNGARDLKDPDEFVDIASAVMFSPANVMQRCGRVKLHRTPDAVGDQRVQAPRTHPLR